MIVVAGEALIDLVPGAVPDAAPGAPTGSHTPTTPGAADGAPVGTPGGRPRGTYDGTQPGTAGDAGGGSAGAGAPAPGAGAGSPSGAADLPALFPRRGGGPYNTAVALARLGSPSAFCSRISTDAFGEALLAGLRSDGVDTTLVQRGPEPTTLAVASIGADGSAGYGFYVEGTADRLFELPDRLPDGVEAVSLGTCSLVLEPGASGYEALLRREAARGVFTLLDPNIRAGLILDPAAYRARFLGWLPHVALLKVSVEDARWLAGDGDLAAALRAWLAAGPSAVVVTRGGDGLSVLSRSGLDVSVPGGRVDVVDTIGAGDTVNAALLHRLAAHGALDADAVARLDADAWRDVLGFAGRAAAVTCSRAGAEPPYAAELSDQAGLAHQTD